jgi:N-acyl-D-amino-acid deacylase
MTRCAPMLPSPVVASLRSVNVGNDAAKVVDADGFALNDAQVIWDPTLSPSPSLGVTTIVTSNCGFGIVPSPPHLRDPIIRNLAVVEGMDLDALCIGIEGVL